MLRELLEVERIARLLTKHQGVEFDVGYSGEETCGARVQGKVTCAQCGTAVAFDTTCENEIEFDGRAEASLPPRLDSLLHELELKLVELDLARSAARPEVA